MWCTSDATFRGGVARMPSDLGERLVIVWGLEPGDFVIGAIPGDPYRRLDGAVDEVSIYDRALTAQEVSAIYAAGAAGKCH